MASAEVKENSKTPNINFFGFQKQITKIAKDIQNHQKKHSLHKFVSSKSDNPHVDGRILQALAPENKEVVKLIKNLDKDPGNPLARMRLVNIVMADYKHIHLDDMLKLMLQSSIPIYLGDIGPTFLQLVTFTYRAYLERLTNTHKHQMMSIRSVSLKNVNMTGIDMSDHEFDDEDSHVKDVESAKTEIQVAESLIDDCETILFNIKSRMKSSLSSEEINELITGTKSTTSFFGFSQEKVSSTKQNMIISKAVNAIDMLKQIPLLQAAGLELAKKLGKVDNKLTYPLVMEGRIQMQALKYQQMRVENGDRTARQNLAPVFNRAVVAYRKALKLVPKSSPKKADLAVLTEFGNLTHYGFVHRDLMKFTEDGIRSLVVLGKESLDTAVTIDDSFEPLQKRLEVSLLQIDETGEQVI
jgi:hypothetical protein